MSRVALLSMDVEDWYHLEYFDRTCNAEWSLLDGLERFASWLDEEGLPATFFCLGELVPALRGTLEALHSGGHEIASHGPDHELPTRIATDTFVRQMEVHKARMEDSLGFEMRGYRAPCFALDREKLNALAEIGFLYDSSLMDFSAHPLYGSIDLKDWEVLRPGVFRSPDSSFVEFSLPKAEVAGQVIPVAGGGYFRILPWMVTRLLLKKWLGEGEVMVFYIHPFECSPSAPGPLPPGTSALTRFRFSLGRRTVMPRLRALVRFLEGEGFTFRTFSSLLAELCPEVS